MIVPHSNSVYFARSYMAVVTVCKVVHSLQATKKLIAQYTLCSRGTTATAAMVATAELATMANILQA